MRFQLLSIWTRLFLTTLDIIYYKARLHFQRFRFWLEEEWSMYRDNDKFDNDSNTNKPEPHSRYAKNKSAHNKQSSKTSRSDYQPYEGPVSMTP